MSNNVSSRRSDAGREYEGNRYAVPHNILRSEAIYGEGFQSSGGLAAFKETVLPELPLTPGNRLLDVGSGLGGAAFHLVAEHAVEVVGVDPAELMISITESRRSLMDPLGRTRFVRGDVFSDALEPGSFDAVYSQDSLLFAADKVKVLARCAELLRPGGAIVINDFCRGGSTPEFEEYVESAGYHLVAVPFYPELLAQAGFTDATGRDVSTHTRQLLRRDLDAYLARAESDPAIGHTDVEHLVDRWHRKIGFMDEGALTQGLFRAAKPISH
ncbi:MULTISPECIES: methyltransferase domain-containing protein [unclassified Streptomyces]|uniref:methyltransferase domain-containing protein n=1 Tax=unclassified Streptomyces TaxID=2593676 RepID=UPI0037BB09AE